MPEDRHLEITSDLLGTAKQNYDDKVAHSNALDDRAQKTTQLAGIFLAVAFAFLQPKTFSDLHQAYGNYSLLLYPMLLCFLISVALCLNALWYNTVPIGGLTIAAHTDACNELLAYRSADVDAELMMAYKINQINNWAALVADRAAINASKSRIVEKAQWALAAGIVLATVNVVILGAVVSRSPSGRKEHAPMKSEQSDKRTKTSRIAFHSDAYSIPLVSGNSGDGDLRDECISGHEENRTAESELSKKRNATIGKLLDSKFIEAQLATVQRSK